MKKTITTSIMDQYRQAKALHPGMILLFRVGDFYEAFDEDARTVGKAIGLTITSRGEVPMAGFPYHQLEVYLRKLLQCGHRVAICEQVQDAANVPVRREVTRTVVPSSGEIVGYHVTRQNADGDTEYLRIEQTSPVFQGRWYVDSRKATTFTSEETAKKDADRMGLREPGIKIVPSYEDGAA